MSFAIDEQCIQCGLKRYIEEAQALGTQAQTMAYLRDILRMYLDAPETVSSPWFAPQVADLLQKHYGLDADRFRQEKQDSNAFVLARLDNIREKVFAAPDPVLAGLQFALLGNYLDFSALRGQVNFDTLDQMLDKALEMELDGEAFQKLCQDLEQGRKLLYLTDNAGEIGFDRIFAEAIAAKYPDLSVTFCVRGAPALNDATREDAAQMGIPFPVIDNGNRVPGTQLDLLSGEARQAMDSADVILAKGMANVETMFGCGYNVYYAFLVKCPRFMTRFQKPMMAPMLVREKDNTV